MKSPSLSEELLDRYQKSPPKQGTRLLKAHFAAHKKDIEEALLQGWSISQIWNVLHSDGRYPGSYSSFNRHCLKLTPKNEEQKDTTPEKTNIYAQKRTPPTPPDNEKKDWSIRGAPWKPEEIDEKSLI